MNSPIPEPERNARSRLHTALFGALTAVLIAFAVWSVLLVVSVSELRVELEQNVRAVVGIGTAVSALEAVVDESEVGAEEVGLLAADLAAIVTALDTGGNFDSAILSAMADAVAVVAADAESGEVDVEAVELVLAESDAVVSALRGANAQISVALASKWRSINILVVASLLLAAANLALVLGLGMGMRQLREVSELLRLELAERERAQDRLRANEERYALAMLGANDGLWDWDLRTGEVYYSPRWRKMLGMGPVEGTATTDTWFDRIHPEDRARVDDAITQHRHGKTSHLECEYRIQHADGEYRWVLCRGLGVLDDQDRMQRMAGSQTDITARKKAEAALRDARDAAVESTRLKSEFLANMSHEIRTPMNAIVGMTELLLLSGIEGERRSMASDIQASADALLTIINDILDFSKIEAGKLTFVETDFEPRAAIGAVVRLLDDRAHRKGIALTAEVDDSVPTALLGDPVRVRQVLTNLVGNAIKFTDEGEVSISARAERLDERRFLFVLEVSDSGVGIPDAERQRIFEAFLQVDGSTTRQFGGTGLGLAIVARLVDEMNGTVEVRSAVGEGSTFTVTLPLHAGKAERISSVDTSLPTDATHWSGGTAPRVLVAEDNAVNRRMALLQLERLGIEADSVTNGREAVEAVRTGTYDLVLMDCQMPILDGYAATGEIRRLEGQGTHTPIVAMTAHAMAGDREKCLAAGMDDYVPKPLRVEVLVEVLDRWVTMTPEAPHDDTTAAP